MSEEEYSNHVEALAVKRLDRPKKLSMECGKHWGEILSRQYNFDRGTGVQCLKTKTCLYLCAESNLCCALFYHLSFFAEYIYIYIYFLLSSPLNSALNCCCCLLFSDNIEVALLRTLTKEDLLTFYKVYICTQTYNCLMKRMLPDETLM